MKIDLTYHEQQLLGDAITHECTRLIRAMKDESPIDPFNSLINKGRRQTQLEYEDLYDKIITAKGDDSATSDTTRKGSPSSGATAKQRARKKETAAPDQPAH